MLDFVADEIASGLTSLLFRLVPSIAVEVESFAYHLGASAVSINRVSGFSAIV